ncbi:hypothetical protein Q9Q94_11540 [Uliginosibacterium sp. 31-16]|uniref:hypothetical protein n=1 Tax=Uliginosibacterium sp. 31-16 TaxID=3068315 RepID=UPI00273D0AEB|nr:hypothetical protein [Uliginosibacterium sp. 31-16]MDP5240165.1 hypothetical protein [Uliginosibacterium sp. 31-16]
MRKLLQTGITQAKSARASSGSHPGYFSLLEFAAKAGYIRRSFGRESAIAKRR